MSRLAPNLRFVVVGIGDEQSPDFSLEIRNDIARHRVFSGGERHRLLVESYLPEGARWIDVTVPLSAVFEQYKALDESVMVFASGDPLFFGYTTTLMREFPGRVEKTYPYFNSLQLLAHALSLPYNDMHVCSLTGRPWHEFDRLLIERKPKIGALTDRRNTPRAIAQRMLDYGYSAYRMHIGVRLGGASEQVYSFNLEEVAKQDFQQPNCIILEATEQLDLSPRLGIPEQDFHLLNGRAKMITKMPIRLLSLSMLELHKHHTLWDVGFCTGSVSIEARLQFPHLHVRSFEIRPEGDELITINARRHGALGIQHHIGDFVELDISELPKPDAIFIGGHGGKLREIVAKIVQHAGEDAVLVFNSVSEESLNLFRASVAQASWHITSEMLIALDDHNPITILQAKASSK